MCGIAGILDFSGAAVDQAALNRMTDVMAHRGPDAEGRWTEGPISLGHRRLSIIDLSDHARQPMVSGDGACAIVFNGEIYNYRELGRMLSRNGYRLTTNSDTEVILGLYQIYGISCLHHLRGMFAFAIWDRSTNQLFLARDRVGIKPLYYLHGNDRFVFASEIKAVIASGASNKKVDVDALLQYMRFLVIPQPASVFSDVRKLDPGSYLLVKLDGSVSTGSYWQVAKKPLPCDGMNEADFVAQLNEALNESVGYHMVADVPVGAFLSGGLDSSSVVAMMRHKAPSQQISTFSTIFPGLPDHDEDRYARIVSAANKTDHYAEAFGDTFLDDYDRIIWYLDEPYAISSAYASYYLAKNAARKTKVVLTGDGGDELFAGYEGYKNDAYLTVPRLARLASALYQTAFSVEKLLRSGNRHLLRLLSGLARRLGSEGLRYSEQVAQSSLYAMSRVLKTEVFLDGLAVWQGNLMARYYDSLGDSDRLLKKLYSEYKTRLVDEMLMKVDRTTMAHGLEARVPLLDHKVVELAFRIPSELKLREVNGHKVGKFIFKKVMEPYLPNDIIYRRKQGFNIPIRLWMRGDFLTKICSRIMDGRLVKVGMLSQDGVGDLMSEHRNGKRDHHNMLMLLYSLESWVDAYESRLGKIAFH